MTARVGVLISGGGTNLQALLDAERDGTLAPGAIVCVVSNKPGVAGLDRARAAGKPAVVVDHKQFLQRAPFEDALHAVLTEHRVDLVVLAGFMRVLTPHFLDRWVDRVINIHPSLLPSFPGVDAQKQAFEHGAKVTGCTVHFVNAELDAGAIILQDAVPIEDGDDAEAVRRRILAREHVLLPRAVQLFAAGRLRREGRRVRIVSS